MNRNRLKTRKRPVRKACFFCEAKEEPVYKNTIDLHRFVTERGKIMNKMDTGICSKHQRHLAEAIKRARYMAMLPYIIRPR